METESISMPFSKLAGAGFEQTHNPSWKAPFLDQSDVKSDASGSAPVILADNEELLRRFLVIWNQLSTNDRLALVETVEADAVGQIRPPAE